MNEIAELARARGFERSRVLWKANARDELVVALLIPPSTPGGWETPPVDREAKRLARQRRE